MPNEKEGSLLYWLFKKRFELFGFYYDVFHRIVVQTEAMRCFLVHSYLLKPLAAL